MLQQTRTLWVHGTEKPPKKPRPFSPRTGFRPINLSSRWRSWTTGPGHHPDPLIWDSCWLAGAAAGYMVNPIPKQWLCMAIVISPAGSWSSPTVPAARSFWTRVELASKSISGHLGTVWGRKPETVPADHLKTRSPNLKPWHSCWVGCRSKTHGNKHG